MCVFVCFDVFACFFSCVCVFASVCVLAMRLNDYVYIFIFLHVCPCVCVRVSEYVYACVHLIFLLDVRILFPFYQIASLSFCFVPELFLMQKKLLLLLLFLFIGAFPLNLFQHLDSDWFLASVSMLVFMPLAYVTLYIRIGTGFGVSFFFLVSGLSCRVFFMGFEFCSLIYCFRFCSYVLQCVLCFVF